MGRQMSDLARPLGFGFGGSLAALWLVSTVFAQSDTPKSKPVAGASTLKATAPARIALTEPSCIAYDVPVSTPVELVMLPPLETVTVPSTCSDCMRSWLRQSLRQLPHHQIGERVANNGCCDCSLDRSSSKWV